MFLRVTNSSNLSNIPIHTTMLVLHTLHRVSPKLLELFIFIFITKHRYSQCNILFCEHNKLYVYKPTRCTKFLRLDFIFLLHATGWTVRGSNPGGGEIFRTRPDRPWGLPSLLYKAHRVFPGGKAAGA